MLDARCSTLDAEYTTIGSIARILHLAPEFVEFAGKPAHDAKIWIVRGTYKLF